MHFGIGSTDDRNGHIERGVGCGLVLSVFAVGWNVSGSQKQTRVDELRCDDGSRLARSFLSGPQPE